MSLVPSRPAGRRPAPKIAGWRNVDQIYTYLDAAYSKRSIRAWLRRGYLDSQDAEAKQIGGVWYAPWAAVRRRKREVGITAKAAS